MKTNKRPLFRRWWFWVLVAFFALLVIGALTSGEKPRDVEEPSVKATVEQPELSADEPETEASVFVDYGEQLSVIDNGAGVCILKYKIKPSYSNNATIQQNYHTVVNFIKCGMADEFDELQYWAVADMTGGEESKAIAFTVSADTMEKIKMDSIVATNIEGALIDLWILPSLLGE